MAAGRYSFNIEQGATFDTEIRYKDSNGNPISLVGYTGRMQIRPSADSETVYLTLSSTRNADNTGLNFSGSGDDKPPTSGSIGIYIAACTSSMLNFNEAYYDLEIYEGTGSCAYTIRLLEGKVRLSKQVTR